MEHDVHARNEETELQIKLAELQASVQINLTICLGLVAVFIPVILSFEQIYFSLPPRNNLLKIYFAIASVIVSLVGFSVFSHYLGRAIDAHDARAQYRELDKVLEQLVVEK